MTTQPIREDQSPRPWFIGIAASAGGIEALRTILRSLTPDLPAAIAVVLHRPPGHIGYLTEVLGRCTSWPVLLAGQGEAIQPRHVYLAPSDSHLTVTPEQRFLSRNGTRIRFVRSSANPLLDSAAKVFAGRAIAVVLSGGGSDASDGVQVVKAYRGLVIAQDPATSPQASMPESAIRTGTVDYVLPVEAIGPALNDIIHERPVSVPAGA
jgi:two-component system, chemotaxis family, protein-glutamate methylesterase/glutaminase